MIERLPQEQRITFARVTVAGALTTLLMGILYLLVGAPVPVIFGVSAAYAVTLLAWKVTGADLVLVRGLLGVTLLGAPLIQYFVGGAAPSGMNAIWAIGVAISAAIFLSGREAWVWLPLFVFVMLGEALSELRWPPPITPRPAWLPIAAGAFNLLGMGLVSSLPLRWLVRQRDAAIRELAAAHERSEKLLHVTLPSSVADRLKLGARTIADRLDATILFADIVGFTALAREKTPEALVGLLDQLFSSFDALVERHGLEKIKTIGDAYMVAGGVPLEQPGHQVAIAQLALDMMAAMVAIRESGPQLHIRIGVHTGPVVAGVIGRKRLAYDLWGDVVNTASRMESHGEPDEIQVTEQMRGHLEDAFEAGASGRHHHQGHGRDPHLASARPQALEQLKFFRVHPCRLQTSAQFLLGSARP